MWGGWGSELAFCPHKPRMSSAEVQMGWIRILGVRWSGVVSGAGALFRRITITGRDERGRVSGDELITFSKSTSVIWDRSKYNLWTWNNSMRHSGNLDYWVNGQNGPWKRKLCNEPLLTWYSQLPCASKLQFYGRSFHMCCLMQFSSWGQYHLTFLITKQSRNCEFMCGYLLYNEKKRARKCTEELEQKKISPKKSILNFKIMNSFAWWREGCRAMWQKLYIRPPGGTHRDRHMNSLTKLTTAIYNLIIVCILWIIIVDRYRCS